MSKPKQISFDRWSNHRGVSLAFRVFNGYQRQAADLLQAISNAGVYAYRWLTDAGCDWNSPLPSLPGVMSFQGSRSLSKPTPINWPANPRDRQTKRKILSVRQWSENHTDAHNWLRLNCVVSALGNFEMYIVKVARLALHSNLGLLAGINQRIDGTIALKHPNPLIRSIDPLIEELTKGAWPARLSAFSRQFGACPAFLQNNVGELEKLRKLRNSVAHAFARDIDEAQNPEIIGLRKMLRLSEDCLVKNLTLLDSSAEAIDQYLLGSHIGEYELVYLYHKLTPSFSASLAVGEKGRRFKQQCGRNGHMISVSFAKHLARYYDTI